MRPSGSVQSNAASFAKPAAPTNVAIDPEGRSLPDTLTAKRTPVKYTSQTLPWDIAGPENRVSHTTKWPIG